MELDSLKLRPGGSQNKPLQIPQAPEIEEVVIAEIMVDPSCLNDVFHLLSPEMFYSVNGRILYDAIKKIHQVGKEPDLSMITRGLTDSGELDILGGPMYLFNLTRNVVSSRRISDHIDILQEKFIRRKMMEGGEQLSELAQTSASPDEIKQLLNNLQTIFDNIAAGGERPAPTRKVIADTLTEIEEEFNQVKNGIIPGVPTGIPKLDRWLGNLRSGTMTIIGARTGVGKTSVAVFIAVSAAQAGKKVIFCGFEQKRTDLMRTLLAMFSRVNRTDIRDSRLKDSDWKAFHEAVNYIENLEIGWLDNPNLNAIQIAAIIRNEIRHNGCDLLIVDYLQLIPAHIKTPIREREVSAISRELKSLALSENIAILALSQLNRDASNGEPKLEHLRESGSLEQDSDNVILLWKPEDDESDNKIKVQIDKCRRGQRGETEIYHDEQMMWFAGEPHELPTIF